MSDAFLAAECQRALSLSLEMPPRAKRSAKPSAGAKGKRAKATERKT